MDIIKILLCVTGTLGFCSILNMPKNKIIFAVMGAAISATIFEGVLYYTSLGEFSAASLASLSIGIYSEIMARLIKTPSTVILLPSTIPLLPGGTLYYAMNYLVSAKYNLFLKYAIETISVGFGIAVGAIITSILVKALRHIRHLH